jgi:hypothetical protein
MKVLGSTKPANITNSPIWQAIQEKEHAGRYVPKCLMHRIRKERHKYVVYTHNIMVNRIGALKTIF